jgi:signal peptidase I
MPWVYVVSILVLAVGRAMLEFVDPPDSSPHAARVAARDGSASPVLIAKIGIGIAMAAMAYLFCRTEYFRGLELGPKVAWAVLGVLIIRGWLWLENRRAAVDGAATVASGADEDRISPWVGFAELLDSALVALALVFFIIKPFVLQAFFIPSGSMKDTLLLGDRLVVSRFAYRFGEPQRGDVVVFKAPPQADENQTEFIKRLIGLPGDRIKVEKGTLFVNGLPVEEPYIRERPRDRTPSRPEPGALHTRRDYLGFDWYLEDDQVVVPEGHYFMMGDNRNQSRDGRTWGYVPREALVGRAILIFWPPQRVRGIWWPDGVAGTEAHVSQGGAEETRSGAL